MDGRQSSASALLVQHRMEIPLNVFFFPFFLSRDVECGGMRGPTFDRTRAQLEERENGKRKRVPWAERQQSPDSRERIQPGKGRQAGFKRPRVSVNKSKW